MLRFARPLSRAKGEVAALEEEEAEEGEQAAVDGGEV
jgi:hypothetical protein